MSEQIAPVLSRAVGSAPPTIAQKQSLALEQPLLHTERTPRLKSGAE
jgi:hypothetical protein